MTGMEAAALARQLMNQHGLQTWCFAFDRAVRRAGCCKWARRMITLSIHFVAQNDPAEIHDTILHEIAHALAGPGEGHNAKWKAICRRIGARPVRCYDDVKVAMPAGRYKAACDSCKRVFHRHRRPSTRGYHYCKKCGPDKGRLTYRSM